MIAALVLVAYVALVLVVGAVAYRRSIRALLLRRARRVRFERIRRAATISGHRRTDALALDALRAREVGALRLASRFAP